MKCSVIAFFFFQNNSFVGHESFCLFVCFRFGTKLAVSVHT